MKRDSAPEGRKKIFSEDDKKPIPSAVQLTAEVPGGIYLLQYYLGNKALLFYYFSVI